MGGSFNPAHEGHLFISLSALTRLGLDCVWWLVSPQNPLKPAKGMAPMRERLQGARRLIRDCRIQASDIEARLGARYSVDTIRALRRLYPNIRFVWLMGADNLEQIPLWRRWREIFKSAAVAVLDRSPYSYKALSSRAATLYARRRRLGRKAGILTAETPPVWTYIRQRRHPASATALRNSEKSMLDFQDPRSP